LRGKLLFVLKEILNTQKGQVKIIKVNVLKILNVYRLNLMRTLKEDGMLTDTNYEIHGCTVHQ